MLHVCLFRDLNIRSVREKQQRQKHKYMPPTANKDHRGSYKDINDTSSSNNNGNGNTVIATTVIRPTVGYRSENSGRQQHSNSSNNNVYDCFSFFTFPDFQRGRMVPKGSSCIGQLLRMGSTFPWSWDGRHYE